MNYKNIAIIGLIGVFGIALLFVFINILSSQSASTNSSTGTSTPDVVVNTTTSSSSSSSSGTANGATNTAITTSSTSKYKDGTYTAAVTYEQPDGTDNLSVSLTIQNDTVTTVKDVYGSASQESKEYQNSFESAISAKVVNKKLDDLNLSRVGGASLTTGGFNKGLAAIIQKAKA